MLPSRRAVLRRHLPPPFSAHVAATYKQRHIEDGRYAAEDANAAEGLFMPRHIQSLYGMRAEATSPCRARKHHASVTPVNHVI